MWGFAPFQSLYHRSPALIDSLARMPEWNLVIALLAALCAVGFLWAPLVHVLLPLLLLAIALPLGDAIYTSLRTRFGRPRRKLALLRATTLLLHLAQPLARLIGRIGYGLTPWSYRVPAGNALPRRHELAVWSEDWREPRERLEDVHQALRRTGLAVSAGGPYDAWDLEIRGGTFGATRLLFAAEDHGAGNQYLRFRLTPRYSRAASFVSAALVALAIAAASGASWIVAAVLVSWAAVLFGISVRQCGIATAAARQGIAAPALKTSKLDVALVRLAVHARGGPK